MSECRRVYPPHDEGCNAGAPYDNPVRRPDQCSACWMWHRDPEKKREDWKPREAPAPPTFAERVRMFFRAFRVESRWRMNGGRAPTTEEKAERRRICNDCPFHDAELDACLECGCYLEAGIVPPRPLGKLDCATQVCPKGKWSYVGGYAPPAGCGTCGS